MIKRCGRKNLPSQSKMLSVESKLCSQLLSDLGYEQSDDEPISEDEVGMLSLFGIVLNTGNYLHRVRRHSDRQLSRKRSGDGPINGLTKQQFRDCLIDAGKMRMLPIFLTTATTVGGLIPLALSGGPLWEGMPWLMIFGLLVATLLTLYVIPTRYASLVETFHVKPLAVTTI